MVLSRSAAWSLTPNAWLLGLAILLSPLLLIAVIVFVLLDGRVASVETAE